MEKTPLNLPNSGAKESQRVQLKFKAINDGLGLNHVAETVSVSSLKFGDQFRKRAQTPMELPRAPQMQRQVPASAPKIPSAPIAFNQEHVISKSALNLTGAGAIFLEILSMRYFF